MSNSQQFTVLRTLRGTNLPEMVEDLNHNFATMLNVYATRGFKGDTGGDGQIGGQGSRGASFMILDIEKFQANFQSPVDPNEIVLQTINDAVDQNAILFFKECTNFDDIVHNDMLILPSGFVIQYNSVTGHFMSTRLRLYNTTDTWTREQIIQLIEEYSQKGDGLYKAYSGINKIVSDDQPSADVLNSVFNQNAVSDIGISTGGVGFESKSVQYIGLQETAGIIEDNRVQLSVIDGHSLHYHEVVQNTIAQNKLINVPKVDNFPIKVMLQNQNSNGFIFGSPELETLDKFGHIRKTADALDIMPYYTNDGTFINSATSLSLSQTQAILRANNAVINAHTGSVDIQIGSNPKISVNTQRSLINNTLFLDTIKKPAQSVASVLPTGEVVTVPYKTTGVLSSTGDALPIEALIVKHVTDAINNRLGWSTSETVKFYLDDIYTKLNQTIQDLSILNMIAGAFKSPNGAVLAYRGNTIPAGWQIVTKLRGRTIVGLDPNDFKFNLIGKQDGNQNITLLEANMPRHSHRMRKVGYGTEGGNRWGWVLGNANETGSNGTEDKWTAEAGSSQPFWGMNPYEVVHFIEFVG